VTSVEGCLLSGVPLYIYSRTLLQSTRHQRSKVGEDCPSLPVSSSDLKLVSEGSPFIQVIPLNFALKCPNAIRTFSSSIVSMHTYMQRNMTNRPLLLHHSNQPFSCWEAIVECPNLSPLCHDDIHVGWILEVPPLLLSKARVLMIEQHLSGREGKRCALKGLKTST